MIDPKTKEWIDNASLYDLLSLWRRAETGNPLFQGETGKYYQEVMFAERSADPAEWVSASKAIGW